MGRRWWDLQVGIMYAHSIYCANYLRFTNSLIINEMDSRYVILGLRSDNMSMGLETI